MTGVDEMVAAAARQPGGTLMLRSDRLTPAELAGGTQARQVVIGGDSSGGGLALAALVALRDAGDPLPGAAVIISPWTDLSMGGESLRSRAAVDVMLTPDGAREAANWYLAGRMPGTLRPRRSDLHGLPPVLIQAGDAEILRDDSIRFAAAGTGCGCRCDPRNLGGDAACLARVRRVAAGGGRGRRADPPLAARGSTAR